MTITKVTIKRPTTGTCKYVVGTKKSTK